MEQPVRIVGNDKIRTFNEKVRNGIEHALNFMLAADGDKIQVSAFEPFLMPIEAYLSAYRKKSILIKIFAERAYQGELYWFFELRTAIALGCIMRMMPAVSISERLSKGLFDETDQDAFGEVGNQLSGILDRAFRTLTRKDVHLRMDFNKKVYPDESINLESFKKHEEYVVFLATITLPTYGSQKLTLLLPRSLYEVLLNLEVQLEGITPKLIYLYSWNTERMEKIQTALNSRYTKVIPLQAADDVFNIVDTPGISAIGLDLKGISFPLSLQDSIYMKRLASNRSFLRLPNFLTWENANEAGVEELKKMNLNGATPKSMEKDFSSWIQNVLKDPPKG